MALFTRRAKGAPALSTTLPGLTGEARRFFRTLVGHQQRFLDRQALQGVKPESTWANLQIVAAAHDNLVKSALREVRSVNVLDPTVQRAIKAALDPFAVRLGVRGHLVQAWGAARL